MSQDLKLDIGSNIKFFREQRKISQESLGFDLGISQQAVQQIESSKIKVDINRAASIADSLDIGLAELLTHRSVKTQYAEKDNTTNPANEKLIIELNNEIDFLKEEINFLQNQILRLTKIIDSDMKKTNKE